MGGRLRFLPAAWCGVVIILSLLAGHVGQHHSVIDLRVLMLQISQNTAHDGIEPSLVAYIEHICIVVFNQID